MSTDQTIQVKVSAGGKTVLTSGVVHLSGEDHVEFKVSDLRFVVQFKTDDGESRYGGELKDGALHIHLFNHNSSLGEGILEPIELATVSGKSLSLTYFTSTVDLKGNKRRLEYAFYLGDAK